MNSCIQQYDPCDPGKDQALAAVNPIKLEDPVLQTHEKTPVPIVDGPSALTYTPYAANSSSTSLWTWNIDLPNLKIMTSRRCYLRVPVTVSMTSADTGQLLFQSGYEGFRESPIASITNTVQATINSQSFTVQLGSFVHALQKYCNKRDFRDSKMSTSYMMTDYYQEYADGVNTNKNPLASYTGDSYEMGRGAFILDASITTNTNTAFTATFTIMEPIMMSPFAFGDVMDKDGFLYLNNLNLSFNLENQLFNRMWSRSSGATALSSSAISFGTPQLLLRTYSLPPSKQCMLPSHVSYPYFQIQRFSQNHGTIGINASATITSNNVQLRGIPHRIYIFARENDASLSSSVTHTDTFANISNISVNFNNKSGSLSSATEQDLFELSCANGYQYSFQDWHGTTLEQVGTSASYVGLQGSVLCLVPGKDFPLDEGLCPGTLGQANFQYTLQVKNVNQTRAINYDLYTIILYRGVFITDCGGSSSVMTNVVSPEVYANARGDPFYSYEATKCAYGGGSFFGQIGKDLLQQFKTIGDVAKDVFTGHPGDAFKKVGNQALRNLTALPRHLGEAYKDVTSIVSPKQLIGLGAKKRGRPRKKKGGKMITKAELMRRLKYV